MNKCEKCGKNIDAASKFCPHCGAPQTLAESAATTEVKKETVKSAPKPETNGKSGGKTKLPIIAVAAIAVIALLVILFLPKKMEIAPVDYVRVEVSGLNGDGKAELQFDTYSFISAIKTEKKLTPAEESAIEGLLQHAEDYFSFSSETGLSNGEEVVINCSMPEKYLSDYKVKLLNDTFTYTVAGLIEMQIINLNDYFNISFNGFNGKGYMNYHLDTDAVYSAVVQMIRNVDTSQSAEDYIQNQAYTAVYNSYSSMSVSQEQELSNGDKIVVSCPVNVGYDRIAKYGVVFTSEDVEIEVTGLEEIETISVKDYLKTEFYGYDGAGYLEIGVDTEKLLADMTEKYPEGRNGYTPEDIAYYVEDYIRYSFSLSSDYSEGLSNGDVVQIYADYDGYEENPYISYVGIIPEGGEISVTVENLEIPQEVDIMDAIIVNFSGIAPNVYVDAEINYDNPLNDFIDYDSFYNIPDRIVGHNGTTLDITLEYYAEDALRNGYLITNNQRTYEVSGLETYDYTLADVNDERLRDLIEATTNEYYYIAMDETNNLINNTSGSGIIKWDQTTVTLTKVLKYYADSAYSYNNRTFFVYEVTFPVLYQNGSTTNHTVYALYYFNDAVEGVDGTLTIPDGRYSYFFYNQESLAEALAEIPASMEVNEGYECEVEEFVNDVVVEIPAEAAAEVVAQAAVQEKTIPEISSDVTAQAAAVAEYDGHRYYRFDTPVTWDQAAQFCNGVDNAHMVTVSGKVENSVLRKLIEDAPLNNYWIGATDADAEGNWKWITGEEFAFRGWDSNQPDNHSGTEHYAYISKSYGGYWNDDKIECGNVGFILEVETTEEDAGEYLEESDTYLFGAETDVDTWVYDTYGNVYYETRCYDASAKGRTMYTLNGEYSRFTGTVAIYEKAASDVSINFAVFGDGELLYKQTAITRETKPIHFDIDVTGIELLTIKTNNWGGTSEDWVLLGDPKLYPSDVQETSNKVRLLDLNRPNSLETGVSAVLWRDAFGEWADNSIYFDARYGACEYVNLNKEYSLFEGTFTVGTETANKSYINVEVYGDDELLFAQEGISKFSGSVAFSIDVTGKQLLKIVTSEPNEQYDAYLYLTNGRLTKVPVEAAPVEESTGTALALQKPMQISENALADVLAMAEYGTRKYYIINKAVTWDEAKAYCETAGGHLAVITTPLEQRRIELLLKNKQIGEFWIGGIDVADDQWVWVTNEPMEYTYWRDGQPDNFNEVENYLSMYDDGRWNDRPADAALAFVMEISPDSPATYGKTKELAALKAQMLDSRAFEYKATAYDFQGNMRISSYYMNTNDDARAVYDLNGEFTSISGVLCSSSESKSGADMDFAIYGDGVLLYEAKDMYGSQKAINFEADVTGVKTLKFRTRNRSDQGGKLLLNDVVLTTAETPMLNEAAVRLNDLQIINSAGMETHDRLFEDTYGNVYDGDTCLTANDDESAVYLLDEKYKSFSCVIAARETTNTYADMNIAIYGDDQLLFSQNGITKATGPIAVNVDVTGVGNLKIASSSNSDKYEEYMYIVNDQLK